MYTQKLIGFQNLRNRDITVKMYVIFKVHIFLFYEKLMNTTEDPKEPEISKSEVLGFVFRPVHYLVDTS
jgi:hypothetical protein